MAAPGARRCIARGRLISGESATVLMPGPLSHEPEAKKRSSSGKRDG